MRLRNIRGSKDVIASCPFVVQEPESCRGRWAEVFGNENHRNGRHTLFVLDAS